MQETVLVAGVGMTPFKKPGDNLPYPEMAALAIRQALQDAGLVYSDIQDVYAGYVYGDSTCGQRALRCASKVASRRTSTTIAHPVPPPCTSRARPSPAARPTAPWLWASSRCPQVP